MLSIRLARTGKRNKAYFKVILQEHTVAPGGRHVEVLGSYDPHKKVAVLEEEKIKNWISRGVKVSDTAHNLFVSKGLISGEKRKVKLPKKVEVKEGPASTQENLPAQGDEKPEETEAKEEKKSE